MGSPILVGIDPGFASIGLARLSLQRGGIVEPCRVFGKPGHTEPRGVLMSLRVVETKKSDKKQEVYASSDNLRRVYELCDVLEAFFDEHPPVAIAAEAMSFPRNASAAGKVCLTWGLLGSIAHRRNIPIIQTSPQEVKRQVAGRATASKEDIKSALRKLYPVDVDFHMASIAGSKQEHAADALAVAHAALESPLVMAVIGALCP